jgi:starch synthase
VSLALPYYRKIIKPEGIYHTGVKFNLSMGSVSYEFNVFKKENVYFFASEKLFDREGIYGDRGGYYEDNAFRFAFFSRAVLEYFKKAGYQPDLFHLHDWQTSLIPLYINTYYKNDPLYRKTATVLTIHNAGYQGIFPPYILKDLDIPEGLFTPEGVEFYGNINFLKTGILFSDIITTVSKRYAEEITTPEYGGGLDGILRKRANDLYGILNGIDYNTWSPEKDQLIYSRYSSNNLRGKALCKYQLLKQCSLDFERGKPIVAYIGRLDHQKGIELIISIIRSLLDYGVSLIILGEGNLSDEDSLMKIKRPTDKRLFINIGFDDTLAHRIYAGADIIMMPSKYEPCGLVQMISLRYGTIPVARNTGGLSDTIIDFNPFTCKGTGFLFDDYSTSAFLEALKRAFTVYTDRRRWREIMRTAMQMDFSWSISVSEYIKIYRKARDRKNEYKN